MAAGLLALPLFGNPWRWQGLLLLPLSAVAAVSTLGTWQEATRPAWARIAGVTFAVVLLLSFAVGASTQAVLGGRPYLAGSTEAETFEMTEQVKADLETLRGQTTLLSVTPEQARTLHKQLDEAAAQALEIAERLNPATKESLPVPGLFEAYQRASYAATIEAEALEAQKANSVTPEPSLSAMIEQARKELDVLLGTGEGSVEQAMGLALEQAVGDAP